MLDFTALHRKAMELYDEAQLCRARGDVQACSKLLRQALECESQAAELAHKADSESVTGSVLYKSAAAIAIQCRDFLVAERLAKAGLASFPPDSVREELVDIIEQAERELETQQLEESKPDSGAETTRVSSFPKEAADFQRLVDGVNPAAMLVRIGSRLSPSLRRVLAAEDIWQETLEEAWHARTSHQWSSPSEFRTWLIMIAERKIRNAVDRETARKRDEAREGGQDRASGAEALDDPAAETPSSVAEHAELARLMREALEGLPEADREIVRLRYFEEWDLERIAELMGLSRSNVMSRLRRSVVLYRDRLAGLQSARARRSKESEPQD